MNPMRIKNALINLLMESDSNNVLALAKRNDGKEQRYYDEASLAEAAIINRIIQSRNLPTMIAAEYRLQKNDFEKYAKTPRERENIRTGLNNFKAGLNQYDILLEQPATYRKAALSYFGAQRDRASDVPLDGMRRAISSQITRLQNRQSLTATLEERELLAARRSLLNAIRREYSLKQKEICHAGGEPE